jgi:hypothetical protein
LEQLRGTFVSRLGVAFLNASAVWSLAYSPTRSPRSRTIQEEYPDYGEAGSGVVPSHVIARSARRHTSDDADTCVAPPIILISHVIAELDAMMALWLNGLKYSYICESLASECHAGVHCDRMYATGQFVYAHGNKAYGRSIILVHECALPIMVVNKQVRARRSVECG